MSVMNTELYNALRKANVPEDLAEAAARSVASYEGSATKVDIAELRTEMAELRTEMTAMKAELIKWMVGLHAATLLALIGAVIAIMGQLP